MQQIDYFFYCISTSDFYIGTQHIINFPHLSSNQGIICKNILYTAYFKGVTSHTSFSKLSYVIQILRNFKCLVQYILTYRKFVFYPSFNFIYVVCPAVGSSLSNLYNIIYYLFMYRYINIRN